MQGRKRVAPVEGRDWGRWDYRVPRPFETSTNSASFRVGYDLAFGARERTYCDTCGRLPAWCECVRENG